MLLLCCVEDACRETQTHNTFYIMGITEAGGNCYFMKHEIDKIDECLKESIAATRGRKVDFRAA